MQQVLDDDRGISPMALHDGLMHSGLTPAELARRSGVSRALLRDYMLGAKQPSVPQLRRILRAAGLDLTVQLAPRYVPLSLARLAEELPGSHGERRWRLLQEFLRGYHEADDRAILLSEEPRPVNPEWDALLGGLAEHLVACDRLPLPAWSAAPNRFLTGWWFARATDRDARSDALATTPAAVAGRGVWVSRGWLERTA